MSTAKMREPNRVVKCGCGAPMRARDWRDHWVACTVARSAPVTEQDVKDLEAYEARIVVREAEHQEWLKNEAARRRSA